MLGNIVSISENLVTIELSIDINNSRNLLNLFVLLSDNAKNCVGEIINVSKSSIDVNLIGEFVDNEFVYGVSSKPSFMSKVNLISDVYIKKIIGISDEESPSELALGYSSIYSNIRIGAKVNPLFSNHLAIVGNSGSGKSCCFATIIENLFRKRMFPKNSSFIVIDSFGEYEPIFRTLNQSLSDFKFKNLTTDRKSTNELLQVPIWLLSVDDLALLLDIKNSNQISVVEKALKFVDVFAQDEANVLEYKTSIIADALLQILSSGRSSSQIRDQFFSVLSKYNTSLLNLDSPISQPGYIRPLKHCLLIDESGKIRAVDLITDFLTKLVKSENILKLPDKSYYYNLDDIAYALEFALIDEGVLRNENLYNDIYYIKNNLDTLRTSSDRVYFDYPKFISEDDYIKSLLYLGNEKNQILNININNLDDRLSKLIAKIYSKMLFDYTKRLDNRASMPINIVLEEAHRYVQNDDDINIIGYNIFDRIAKEGRKYGILLTFISQRPSELSSTAISQCSNFMLFRMIHPNDIDFIKSIVPNFDDKMMERVKLLSSGNCILFGNAFMMPLFAKIDMPDPCPLSSCCDVLDIWYK